MTQVKIPADIRWIAAKRENGTDHPIETSYFKSIFSLTTPPAEAVINISANTRYTLYINGIEVLDGPCRGDNWHQYVDAVDIAAHLKTGDNIIAAKVVSFVPHEAVRDDKTNAGPFWAMSNAAGPMLICWGDIGGVDISTGVALWFFLNDTAISWNMQYSAFWMGSAETVDGSKVPYGWETDTATDKFVPALVKWSNSIAFGEIPPMPLYHRPIKHLLRLEKTLHLPNGAVTIAANTTTEYVLDAKDLTTAFLYLPMSGGAGGKITLTYSEAYIHTGGTRNYKTNRSDQTGELFGIQDIYFPSGANETYSPSWFRTFRFLRLTIQTAAEALTINSLKQIETRYPLQDKVQFDAPLPWVQDLWGISRRTLQLCMHETYEDCPYYEQLQYTLDTRLQALYTYALSNDTSLVRKTLHDYHTSILPEGILQSRFPSKYAQVIPAFSLHWIFMLRDYFEETDDRDILDRYRPTVENIMAWYKRHTGEHGLVEYLPYWDQADWTDAWDDIAGVPRATLHGPSTIHNLLYAYALEVCATIMDDLEIDVLATRYRAERAGILQTVDQLCWDETRSLYREGPSFVEFTQHAQMWAVLNKLATGERAKTIMTTVLTDKTLIPCSFVMQYFLFRALEVADMYEETEKLWPLWQELLGLDLYTVPEIPGQYTRSDCHAWGALLLFELPRKFLGVSAAVPGYSKIKIEPKGLFLKSMSGKVPTPFGEVSVSWSVGENGKFAITGNTPVPAEVVLPCGARHEVVGEFRFGEQ